MYHHTHANAEATTNLYLESAAPALLVAKFTKNKFTAGTIVPLTWHHRYELSGNCPVFTLVILIYHNVERIWRILVTPNFFIKYTIIKKEYPVEPVNIHIQSFINSIQENNWVITTKNGKVKLPLSCGNGERLIPIYD